MTKQVTTLGKKVEDSETASKVMEFLCCFCVWRALLVCLKISMKMFGIAILCYEHGVFDFILQCF